LDLWKFFSIGHTHHRYMNPMSEAKFDEIIELLALPAGARVLDIACGKAPLLIALARRYECSGVGVDISPPFIEDARRNVEAAGLSDRIELVHAGGAQYEAAPESFDLACCIGASWIWEGHSQTLGALAKLVRPGGAILVGQPYWRKPPSPEHLQAEELQADSCTTHIDTANAGDEHGLVNLYSLVSSEDDWDRYQALQWNAAERYAHEHPDDPDNGELLERMRGHRESYLRWGRDEMGWALYLYLKP
jgi:SAM-dependent methyltransferase